MIARFGEKNKLDEELKLLKSKTEILHILTSQHVEFKADIKKSAPASNVKFAGIPLSNPSVITPNNITPNTNLNTTNIIENNINNTVSVNNAKTSVLSVAEVESQARAIYAMYEPSKLKDVNNLMEMYKGRETEMLEAIKKKYQLSKA